MVMMMMILKKRLGMSVMNFCFRFWGSVVLICPLHLLPECSLLTQCVNECAWVRQYVNVLNTLKSDRYAVILAYVRECVRLFCLLKYVVMFLPFPSFLFSHLS